MLVISGNQMKTFEQAAVRNFENRLLAHLQEFFPKHCEILGNDQMRKVIQLGLKRAEPYGLISERGLHLYIGLMLMLGSYFDEDPQLPWTAKILTDENIVDPRRRADRLYRRAMAYLNQAAGKDSQYLDRALHKAREFPVSALSRTGEDKLISFGDYLLKLLYRLFFEKYDAVGETNIRQMVRQGYQTAKAYHLTGEPDLAAYICLMFMLGSGFNHDPQYPWADIVLNDAALIDSTQKGESLYKAAMTHLEKWLA